MRAEQLRAVLADSGPITRRDLCAATGLSNERVMTEIWKLRRGGCTIDQDAVYELVHDPEIVKRDRFCKWPGCDTRLHSHNGCGYCGAHRKDAASAKWAGMGKDERRCCLEAVVAP